MKSRFRGFLPVVIDLETGGFEASEHGILEIAAVTLDFDDDVLTPVKTHQWNVIPRPESRVEEASLKVTGIDLDDPNRGAISEEDGLRELFRLVRREIKRHGCQRAIVTAHNAHFDHGFIKESARLNEIKRNPFHPFSVFDTVGLSGVALGHTVLSEACVRAGIAYDSERAHSAAHDAEVTAALFCYIVNGGGGDLGRFGADGD